MPCSHGVLLGLLCQVAQAEEVPPTAGGALCLRDTAGTDVIGGPAWFISLRIGLTWCT